MFTLIRAIGNVPAGQLQPSQISITGSWACANGTISNVPLELRFAMMGAPTNTFTATTNNGTNGPAGTVSFVVPAWAGLQCGDKLSFEVRGLCAGMSTPWQGVGADGLDCLGCPRIQLNAPMLGACSGVPATQSVTLSGVVMLPPGASSAFSWDFGDGQVSPAGTLTNTTNNPNQPLPVSVVHVYGDRSTPYLACLKPANLECPLPCVEVQTTCGTTGCPGITGTVSYGQCTASGARPVTVDLSFNPPLPANAVAQISWAYGGPNVAGQTSATQTVNTAGGPVATVPHTSEFVHRGGGYVITATVVLVIGGQLCPLANSTVTVVALPPPCIPCPDPGNPVTVTVTVPSAPQWCAPMTTALSAALNAQLNWLSPVPPNPPAPTRYDWTITTPSGGAGTATASSTTPSITTASGWGGAAATANGALNLNAVGTYSVAVTAVFGPGSGLPTDTSGTVTCNLTGSATFSLAACQGKPSECPTVDSLSFSSGCFDSMTMAPVNITATATVSDPSGIAQGFDWDFGDPGSSGNTITTATPVANHSYMAGGSFTVTCRVRSSDPNCPPSGLLASTFSIPACKVVRPSCDALLWTALILMAVGALAIIIGCLIATYVAPPAGPIAGLVVSIVGGAIALIGLILWIIWWAVCRFFTACQVILAAIDFIIAMIVVFGIIALIIAIVAAITQVSWPCFFQAIVTTAFWGLLLGLMYRIARAVGCLVPGPGASAGASSGSPLTGSSGTGMRKHGGEFAAYARSESDQAMPLRGMGDAMVRVTSTMGIRSCSGCQQRAAQLNALLPFSRAD